uniref:YadA family autotransporter adhesin n=1 Tax=uncultured Cedecea sp. TaxID=988762 RepID=UPI002603CF76
AHASFANSLALGANSVTTQGAESGYSAYRLTAIQNSVGEVAFGTAGGNRKITGIAAGTNNSDAVNVEQLMAVGSQVDKNTSDISDLGSRITSIENSPGSGETGSTKYFSANSTAGNSVASGTDAVAVGPSAQASGESAIAMGSGAQAQADGSVALGKNSSDGNRGAESYTGKYSGASNNSVGTVSVGNSATGEVRTVSNIADGVQSNDAVNVRQLDGAVAQSKQYTDDSIANLETNAGATNTRVAQLSMGTSGLFRVENAGDWDEASASGKNSVAGGAAATATAKSSTALGTNAHATHENSVALGTNSVTERDNSVSVGSVGNERQVTNVAAATRGTDAVNLTQLNRSMAEAANYTDRRFNQLQDSMNQQDRRLSAGIASAMAMASLPQPYSPGANMISLGGASYRGQSGISFGLSHLSEDGRWVTKAQLNNNTQNNVGWGIGVGYQF